MAIRKFECRAPGQYDQDQASLESAYSSELPSMTVQSGKDDADINVIVKRFGVTRVVSGVPMPPTYGDFTGVSDYRTALDVLRGAQESFLAMSSDVRNRFGNDPARFVAFCSDAKNLDEMRRMGLAVPEKAVEPAPAAGAAAAGSTATPAPVAPAASGAAK